MTSIAINLLAPRIPLVSRNSIDLSAAALIPDVYHDEASTFPSYAPLAPSHPLFRPDASRISSLIRKGAIQAVDNCAKIQKGELTVVVTDRKTLSSAKAIALRAEAVGSNVAFFVMEDFGDRPEDGSNSLQLPTAIKHALAAADVSFYLAQSKTGELESFRKPLIEIAQSNGIRHAHMPNFSQEMMWLGMAANYLKIQNLSEIVRGIVSQAKTIRVTSLAGTDATFSFSQNHKWVVCDGHIRKGRMGNLPGGEVFTAPIDAEGIIVVDVGFGDFFSSRYGNISENPLTYRLKGGRCVRDSVECRNSALKSDFLAYTFENDENADRAGEFAIGTNVELKNIIGNMLQDEKFPGIHVALGSPLPSITGANWDSRVHNDGIIRNPDVMVDGQLIMAKGNFLLDY
jgi:leucyl aminopeptidase (aminopeptidase T)